MKFHAHSGLSQLQQGVEYAGVYIRTSTGLPIGAPRPVKVIFMGEFPVVTDPMAEPDQITVESRPQIQIVGLWSGPVYPLRFYPDDQGLQELAEKKMTWQGYAAQQLGQVLRHNQLAERLTDFGISREPEQYLPHRNKNNAVERSLTLTYDELDRLLKAAGF